MTYNERDIILRSTDFIGKVRVAFCDWLEYWAVNGTGTITDPDLREQTDSFIKMALDNPEAYVNKLTTLVIAVPVVKDAAEITDVNVQTAVSTVMTNALDYLM